MMHKSGIAAIDNELVRVELDLIKGAYSVTGFADGGVRIQDACFRVGDLRSDSGSISVVGEEPVRNAIGNGRKLTVKRVRDGEPEVLCEFALYANRKFVAVRCGIRNTTNQHVRVKCLAPLVGEAFVGRDTTRNYQTLDGKGGFGATSVRTDADVTSLNNLLAMFVADGRKQTLVAGGLTYRDFFKYARVVNPGDRLRLELRADDPQGMPVDPGVTYLPEDWFYVDAFGDNPFTALEEYAQTVRLAQGARPSVYNFPTVDLWYTNYWNDSRIPNDTAGAVREMEDAAKTGFLKYAPVAIMHEPETNDVQGWWDDEHWQAKGYYVAPYETTEKWVAKVTALGGVPCTYFQTSGRAEDYCRAFPEHMLFNRFEGAPADATALPDGTPRRGGYDFTDRDFSRHMEEVYARLRKAGIKGVKYDYVNQAWAADGGFDNPYTTTAGHVRRVFELAKHGLGPDSYVDERGDLQSDFTAGLVDSQRTEPDTDKLYAPMVRRAGLRWYKNRVLFNYYLDAKDLVQPDPCNRDGIRTVLTMIYAVSGKLMLGRGFGEMTPEMIHDLSRVYPFHAQPQTARPIDAFSGGEFPQVFDFAVNPDWHQVTLYNAALTTGETWPATFVEFVTIRNLELPADRRHIWHPSHQEGIRDGNMHDKVKTAAVGVDLGLDPAFGGLGLDPKREYYAYDFWNDRFVGRFRGDQRLEQTLRPHESRMISIHAVKPHPQFISTNRHIMQGFVDMKVRPAWDADRRTLSATSSLIGGEPYQVIIACNGLRPSDAVASRGASAQIVAHDPVNDLATLSLVSDTGGDIEWSVVFA